MPTVRTPICWVDFVYRGTGILPFLSFCRCNHIFLFESLKGGKGRATGGRQRNRRVLRLLEARRDTSALGGTKLPGRRRGCKDSQGHGCRRKREGKGGAGRKEETRRWCNKAQRRSLVSCQRYWMRLALDAALLQSGSTNAFGFQALPKPAGPQQTPADPSALFFRAFFLLLRWADCGPALVVPPPTSSTPVCQRPELILCVFAFPLRQTSDGQS